MSATVNAAIRVISKFIPCKSFPAKKEYVSCTLPCITAAASKYLIQGKGHQRGQVGGLLCFRRSGSETSMAHPQEPAGLRELPDYARRLEYFATGPAIFELC